MGDICIWDSQFTVTSFRNFLASQRFSGAGRLRARLLEILYLYLYLLYCGEYEDWKLLLKIWATIICVRLHAASSSPRMLTPRVLTRRLDYPGCGIWEGFRSLY